MNTQTLLKKRLLFLCGILIISIASVSSQNDEKSDFSYQINRVQKYISISPSQLDKATQLSHLNHYFKADWVKKYKSVKITVISNNQKKVLTSTSDRLTSEQKKAISTADQGTDIKVVVLYLPDNNLTSNEISEMDFSFKLDPEKEAIYAGSKDQLAQYIEEAILKKITIEDVPQYQVAAVKFTIDEDGQIIDVNIAHPSKNEDADNLILKTICEMPKWNSAQYADGTKTKQEFVFTIGDHYSCTMNTLDIKSDVPPSTR